MARHGGDFFVGGTIFALVASMTSPRVESDDSIRRQVEVRDLPPLGITFCHHRAVDYQICRYQPRPLGSPKTSIVTRKGSHEV